MTQSNFDLQLKIPILYTFHSWGNVLLTNWHIEHNIFFDCYTIKYWHIDTLKWTYLIFLRHSLYDIAWVYCKVFKYWHIDIYSYYHKLTCQIQIVWNNPILISYWQIDTLKITWSSTVMLSIDILTLWSAYIFYILGIHYINSMRLYWILILTCHISVFKYWHLTYWHLHNNHIMYIDKDIARICSKYNIVRGLIVNWHIDNIIYSHHF